MAVLRFIGINLIVGSLAFAQQYAFVPVRAPNGPQDIKGLFQDHRGRLWIRAQNGVSCFDGSRFRNLRDFGYPDTEATSLTEDDEGAVWIGSRQGLHRFANGRLTRIDSAWTANLVTVSPGLLLGTIDTGAASGLETLVRVRKDGAQWRVERIPGVLVTGRLSAGGPHRSITFSTASTWAEVTPQAVAEWRAGAKLTMTERKLTMSLVRVVRDRFDCIWLRNPGYTAYQCPGDRRPINLPPSVTRSEKPIQETADGRMLLPGDSTLAIGRPGAFKVIRPINGLPPTEVALEAADGSIWIGGPKGLFRFVDPSRLEYWNERDGLADVNTALRVGDRTFVGDGDGVKILSEDRRSWTTLPRLPELGAVNHIIEGPDRTLILALLYHGVASVRTDGSLVNAPGNYINGMRLARTRDGSLWVSDAAVSRVTFANGLTKLTAEPLPGRHWNGLDIETNPANGDLWSCTSGGLMKKTPGGWQAITEQEGLLQNGCRSLAVAANGDVWYGYVTTPAFSLIRPQPGGKPAMKHFRAGGDIGDATMRLLDFDRRGWLWRGTEDGVYVATAAQAEEGKWLRLSADVDGLPGTGPNQQAFYEEPDGSVWIGMDTAVMHFHPPAEMLESKPAGAFLSALSWDGGAPQMAEAVESIPNGAKLTAHIGSLQFDRRNALRVRYRMLPEQTAWTESRNLDVALGKVAWGRHTLEVQARVGFEGPWSSTSAWPLSVLRPIWFSPQALGGSIAAPLTGLCGFLIWRRRQKRRENTALPDLAEFRLAALTPEAQDLVGSTLDERYRPLRVLARGGFATVMEGLDLVNSNRPCAVKVFRRELADEWMAKRFAQEIAALETINHPNVVRIVGHGATPGGSPYLVMEFIRGTTLKDLLKSGPPPANRIAALLRQLGAALAEIHRHGIFHRDLKPENVMVREGAPAHSDLVLIDFSIAIVKDPDQTLHGLSRAAGTLQYMAPEQIMGYASAASDIYSLAKLTVEMITGRQLSVLLPDAALDLGDRVKAVLRERQVPLRTASLDLIARALEFDPANRPDHAEAFASQIAGDLESVICQIDP